MLLFFRIFGINVKITYGIGARFALKNQISLSKFFKTTKLILLDSLLQEIGDACLLPPPLFEVDQAAVFQIGI
jgi:hypothetical protein